MLDLINHKNLRVGEIYTFTTDTRHLFALDDGIKQKFRHTTTFMILGLDSENSKKLRIFIFEESRTTRITLGDSPVLKQSFRLCRGF